MYDFLSGRIALRKPDYAVLDVNGVGYRVEIPLSTYEKLPREGVIKLFTFLRVSDDDLRLYGFLTEREREIFLKLIDGVQQLGPAKAISILSSVSPEALSRAIESEDVAFLKNIRGSAKKSPIGSSWNSRESCRRRQGKTTATRPLVRTRSAPS